MQSEIKLLDSEEKPKIEGKFLQLAGTQTTDESE